MTTHRRRFTAGLALGAGMAPLAVRAQAAGRIARVGFLTIGPPMSDAEQRNIVWNVEMRRLGWTEGQNLVVERRYADGKLERMPALAQELVEARLDVIMTISDLDAAHVRRLSSTLPIVGSTWTAKFESSLRSAARALRIELDFHWYRTQDDLVAAFPALAAARTSAFLLEPTPQTFANRGRIAELALQHGLPGIFTLREYAAAGGLMSYGPDVPTMSRQLAQQVDRILHGAKPGDLPMEQPTRFDLVLNLKTAKALGLAFPRALLQRADELIE